MAGLAPTGEIPTIGETGALVRLDRINPAGIAIEHDALVSGLLDERKPLPVAAQTGVSIDELLDCQVEIRGDVNDFMCLQSHIPRPFAAGGTALANIENLRIELNIGVTRAAMSVRHRLKGWR